MIMKNTQELKGQKNTLLEKVNSLKDQSPKEQLIDEQVAESYYLESEAWQDIGIPKGYGPANCHPNCSSCGIKYAASSFYDPCPSCGHRSQQANQNLT